MESAELNSSVMDLSDWIQLPLRPCLGYSPDTRFVSVKREAVIAIEKTSFGSRLKLQDGSSFDTEMSYEEALKRV